MPQKYIELSKVGVDIWQGGRRIEMAASQSWLGGDDGDRGDGEYEWRDERRLG